MKVLLLAQPSLCFDVELLQDLGWYTKYVDICTSLWSSFTFFGNHGRLMKLCCWLISLESLQLQKSISYKPTALLLLLLPFIISALILSLKAVTWIGSKIDQQIQNHVCIGANNSSFHQTGEMKHVPDELVRNISRKMTSLQSVGRVPVLDFKSLYELSCYHSTLSVPYYLEDQWRLYYVSLCARSGGLRVQPRWARS